MVSAKLEAGPFANTTNIFASPKTIWPGAKLAPSDVTAYLNRIGYSDSEANTLGTYAVRGNEVEVRPGPQSYFRQQSARIEFDGASIRKIRDAASGEALEAYSLEPELIANLSGGSREKRRLVEFENIPQVLVNAVISVEDKRFFQHLGYDPFRLLKAAYIDVREGRKEQGASTITMQLARALWLEPEKAWRRKFSELMITSILEQRLTKEQIFAYYANQVYLGRRDTFNVHGFGEAARAYFDRDLSQITLPQAALLAGLIQRPSHINPLRFPERAKARRATVLALMHKNGYINAAEYAAAVEAPLGLTPARTKANEWPYVLGLMTDEYQRRVPDDQDHGSHRVYTTVDADLQRAAVEAVRIGMAKVDKALSKSRLRDGVMPQVALVAMDPKTGEVRAAVGGRDYAKSQLNHVLAQRQPGSVFKPFVYAAALNTSRFSPASIIMDAPTRIQYDNQVYEPGNFHGGYFGNVSLRVALAKSLNLATVNLAQQVGYPEIVKVARAAGLNDAIKPTPAVALGAYETTPLEIAGAYTVFANDGTYVAPTFLRRVEAEDGRVVHAHTPERRRALDPRVAFLMRDMLQEVMTSGTAAGVYGLGFKGVAAGKTGTSRDGWFAGFTPDLLCVVWVGFDDNRDLKLEGAKSALPIWAEFMKRALDVTPQRAKFGGPPAGMIAVQIDPESGQLAGPHCPTARGRYFMQGTQPRETCTLHSGGFFTTVLSVFR